MNFSAAPTQFQSNNPPARHVLASVTIMSDIFYPFFQLVIIKLKSHRKMKASILNVWFSREI